MNKKTSYIALFLCLILVWVGRYYYGRHLYNDTLSSWDATWYLIRAFYFSSYFFSEWMNLEINSISQELFSTPFLSPYMISVVSSMLDLEIEVSSKIYISLVSLFFLLFLYLFLKRWKSVPDWIVIIICTLVWINSFFSMYSTEPSKAPEIILFFLSSLFVYAYTRSLFLAFFLLSATYLVHNTWIIFIIALYCIFAYDVIVSKKKKLLLTSFFVLLFPLHAYYLNNYTESYFYYSELKESGLAEENMNHLYGEVMAVISDMKNWFQNIWLRPFLKGSEKQLWLLFWLWLLSLFLLLYKKEAREKNILLLISFIIILFFFWIKWKASSHGSRYPYYINRLYILFWFTALRYYTKNHFIILMLSILWLSLPINYYNTYVWWYRHIYKINKEIWEYVWKNIQIDKDNKILLMWRPDTRLWILKNIWNFDPSHFHYYWRQTPSVLEKIDFGFIKENQISYFLYERTWWDAFKGADVLFKKFEEELVQIESLTDWGREVSLYRFNTNG